MLQVTLWFLSVWSFYVAASGPNGTNTPVVIWHGMGDSCCNPASMGAIQKLIEKEIPNIYTVSLRIGDSVAHDTENGYFLDVNKQVSMVCDQIAKDPKLANGYHAIGFSQGAQFLRGVAQRCPEPPMVNLISVGGQHQGVNNLPHCGDGFICRMVRNLLDKGAYTELVQAQYWHDPLQEELYKKKSLFLADINNEKDSKNESYKENLNKLKNFIMIKFLKDSMVVPMESEWFGFYKTGQTEIILPMNETKLYQEDWIGLKQMDENKKLHFLSVDADHLRLTDEFFVKQIVNKFMRDSSTG